MALRHQQPTAQKLALVGFLHKKWRVEDLQNIPIDFISDVLIPALGQAGMYVGIHVDAIDEGIDVFFAALADSRTSDEAFCDILMPFLRRMKDSQQHYVVQFCSRAVDCICERRMGCFEASGAFLDMIGGAARAQPVFGSNYVSIACHRSLMRLAGMCFWFQDDDVLECKRVLSWIGAIPNGLICKGGMLHEMGVSVFQDILSRSRLDMEAIMANVHVSGEDFLDRECGKSIRALVKASMLMCETDDTVLQHVSRHIKSEVLGTSGEVRATSCYLLSSMMESFVPLEGKQLLESTISS